MPEDLKKLTLSLNAMLTDIYETEKRISEILLDFGLEQSHINALKDEKSEVFYRNVKLALECRFLHYSGGHRLLDILYRRYGLFEYRKETLEEIGETLSVSRERVRQLQNKAIKRLVGGVSSDAVGILLVLCACHALELDAMIHLGNREDLKSNPLDTIENIQDEKEDMSSDNTSEDSINQLKTIDLPKATFYISGGFNYDLRRGKYRMLMECSGYKKYIEKQDLEGHSDVNMILLAVIEGLEMLRKPFDVTIYSNTLFGVSNIYKHGVLLKEVSVKASNFELKEKIRQILEEHGHRLSNIADSEIKEKLSSALS